MPVASYKRRAGYGQYWRWGAVLLLLMLAACDSHTERPSQPEDLIRYGQQIYVANCAACHQADGMGDGSHYPRLAGNPIVTLPDPTPIIVIVSYGQGAMPAFHDTLTSYDIAAVLSYIRNTWGNEAVPVADRQVQ
jgi:alcohol dehydrogenase (quinone), cytochrome c subunit